MPVPSSRNRRRVQANVASASDSFSMSVYSGAGGKVGSLIATVNLGNAGQAATGSLIQSAPEYGYNASFDSVVLGSGTDRRDAT